MNARTLPDFARALGLPATATAAEVHERARRVGDARAAQDAGLEAVRSSMGLRRRQAAPRAAAPGAGRDEGLDRVRASMGLRR